MVFPNHTVSCASIHHYQDFGIVIVMIGTGTNTHCWPKSFSPDAGYNNNNKKLAGSGEHNPIRLST